MVSVKLLVGISGKVYMNKRTKRERQSYNEIGDGDKVNMLHHFDYRCAYCGIKLTLEKGQPSSVEYDHYHSLAEQDRLGDELTIFDGLTIKNTVPSCRSCNRQKKDSNPEEWIKGYCPNANEVISNIEFYFSTQEDLFYA